MVSLCWKKVLPVFIIALALSACKTSRQGIFGKKTPHAQYGDRLADAGLKATALGASWFRVADQSIATPLTITLPYRETGYFAAERPAASGLRFSAVRGQKLSISVQKKPVTNFALYIDLWQVETSGNPLTHLASADTLTHSIQHEVDENATYVLRLQPELLSSGEYTVSIITGPSLAYPIRAPGKNHIKSFWGADRDGGARRHEGIDMFAAFRTPVVAAAPGRITRVQETAIGGKVVWQRVDDRNFTLYYAHLDSQTVSDGQQVQTGDTLGLMGNTGNARTTAPHLHFGVYTFNGPVDPLPFVNPVENEPDNVIAPVSMLGRTARSSGSSAKLYSAPGSASGAALASGTILQIDAATSHWFKVRLPDGLAGFVRSNVINDLDQPVRRIRLTTEEVVFERPDSLAAKKTSIPAGEPVDILGTFQDFQFIKTSTNITGWLLNR